MPRLYIGRTAILAALAIAAACRQGGTRSDVDSVNAALPEGHVPVKQAIPLPPNAQVVIDSGNAAFSAKKYTEALALYRRTLALVPGHPAPWFGISMAAGMLGDSALQDTAQRMLRLRGADLGATHAKPAPPTTVNPHGSPRTS